jgi:isoleucyl-tRNA synthetase
LKNYESHLKEIFNVSQVDVFEESDTTEMTDQLAESVFSTTRIMSGLWFAVLPASGHKCARCWNFMPVVSSYGIWQDVCTRCQSALKEMGIAPPQPEEAAQ